MNKRLLIATDSFLPRWDGISRFLSEIIPELKSSFSITVVAPKFPGKVPNIEGVQIVTVPTFKFRIGDYNPPRFATQLIDELVSNSDLVWVHSIGPIGGTALRCANKHSVKAVSFVHSLEWELVPKSLPRAPLLKIPTYIIMKYIARNLYNKADLIMAPSDDVLSILESNRIKPKKVVVPVGVCVKKFFPPESKAKAKRRLGLDPHTFVIGFCGRVAREKNIPTLFKAFLQVNHDFPQSRLMIVGAGVPALNKKLSHPNVIQVGSTNNVLKYLQAMDVYVLPSLTETSSLSTMEAMACGLPVIVTPVGSMKFYIDDGKNGFFFPKRDSQALRQRIEALMLKPGLRKRSGAAARYTIESHHLWEHTSRQIKRILLDL
ncbi:MAG: glycosyltransferase family 4 protein [Candidatus Woesearchaeota archaeon]